MYHDSSGAQRLIIPLYSPDVLSVGVCAIRPTASVLTVERPIRNFEFIPVDGCGEIRSWTVMRQSFLPGFEQPFVLVDVELTVQPGLRLIGRLVDGPSARLRLGLPVRLAFEDVAPGVSVAAFALEIDS